MDVSEGHGFLEVLLTGRYSFADFCALEQAIVEQAAKFRKSCVLVDISRITGDIPDWDRYQLGLSAAEAWRNKIKVAIMDRPQDNTDFAENVAVNHGAQVDSFLDRQKAIDWLLSEEND